MEDGGSGSGLQTDPSLTWGPLLNHEYKGAMLEEDFVKQTHGILQYLGFETKHTLACVSLCRDEMCHPFLHSVSEQWKHPFNLSDGRVHHTHPFLFSSLAGLPLLGKLGFGAAISHGVPHSEDGRQRFVFYVLPHIGIGYKTGVGCVLGLAHRPGISEVSKTCGALVQLHSELTSGAVYPAIDPDDVEYSFLKTKLTERLGGTGPFPNLTLKDLTGHTYAVIVEDLEKLIKSHKYKLTDYAVLSGILIHAPNGKSYVWPGKRYAFVNGVKVYEEVLLAQRAE